MIRTITARSCVSVQGIFERDLDNGRIVVRVGEHTYVGRPIAPEKMSHRLLDRSHT